MKLGIFSLLLQSATKTGEASGEVEVLVLNEICCLTNVSEMSSIYVVIFC